MKETLTPETMKTTQIKQAKEIIFQDAKLLTSNDNDERRAYFQGARQMAHVFYMIDLVNEEQSVSLFDLADEEVQKTFQHQKP